MKPGLIRDLSKANSSEETKVILTKCMEEYKHQLELDIKNIWEELGLINGTSYEEELLDEMFSRFCLGK